MKAATDPPTFASMNTDDFVEYLETVIETAQPETSSAEEEEAKAENGGTKRRKVEKGEGSLQKDVCTHPGSLGGMCYSCGKELDDHGVPFAYIHKGLRISNDEIDRLRQTDYKKLLQEKKLYLVLDLDHTLLNSTPLGRLTPAEEYLKTRTDSLQDVSRGNLFLLQTEDMHILVKLRPFVHTFLKEAKEIFEMHIYTLGSRSYALEMAKLIDPKQTYFGNRIISREDGTVKNQKGLDVVLAQESAVLIVDDTEETWGKHKDNLILMARYHYFASSCRQYGFDYTSLSESQTDESDTQGALQTFLTLLRRIHHIFYNELGGDLEGNDVREVLKAVRKEVLKGCTIVFCRGLPTNSQASTHHLWRMAEQLGATCLTDMDPSATHVVSLDALTVESRWAVETNKFLVLPRWVEAANYMWQKQPEHYFLVTVPSKQ